VGVPAARHRPSVGPEKPILELLQSVSLDTSPSLEDSGSFSLVSKPELSRRNRQSGYLSGWRKSEIASLTWQDVDLMGKVIRLRPENSKNGTGRVLALEGELWQLIESQWQMRQHENDDKTVGVSLYVFHRDGLPVGDIRKVWATARKKAGAPGLLFHDLRRTAVRNMVRAGVPERVAMTISGHKTRAIFDRYNIVSEEDLRQAMAKTQEHLRSLPDMKNVIELSQASTGDVQ
jgi:integrase